MANENNTIRCNYETQLCYSIKGKITVSYNKHFFTIIFEQFYSQSLQKCIALKFLFVLSKVYIKSLLLIRKYDETYKTKNRGHLKISIVPIKKKSYV